jgi:hypothetical protein
MKNLKNLKKLIGESEPAYLKNVYNHFGKSSLRFENRIYQFIFYNNSEELEVRVYSYDAVLMGLPKYFKNFNDSLSWFKKHNIIKNL